MAYVVKIQVSGPGCELNFNHSSSDATMATMARKIAAALSGGESSAGDAPAISLTGLKGPYSKKAVGVRVKADGFECPSSVFGKASQEGARVRLSTEIGAGAPKSAGTTHQILFGDDEEYDFDYQLGGGEIGAYTCQSRR